MLKILAKYWAAYTFSFREIVYYAKKLQVSFLMTPIRIIIMILLYQYAFSYVGKNVAGIDSTIAVWSIAIYHILLFTQFRGIFDVINTEIRNGVIEMQLIKPYSYILFKISSHLGKSALNFGINTLVALLILFIFTPGLPFTFDLSRFLGFLALAFSGTIVSAGLYVLIALASFWIDDADPLYWIVDKLILILGGSYIPVIMLPNWIKSFNFYSPFGSPMFATQVFNPNFWNDFPKFILNQLTWGIILFTLIFALLAKANRKISINGG